MAHDHVSCPRCDPIGAAAPRRPCRLCQGTGQVTCALAQIYTAHRLARAIAPEWTGADDSLRPGITIFSLAAYYRRRPYLRRKAARARGRPGGTECFGVVELLDREGRTLAAYHGFAWGYGGEGPSGLAALLADVFPEAFPSLEEALRFVISLPQEETWTTPQEETTP
jgi:hypothetical protein